MKLLADGWINVIVFGLVAFTLVIFTRGTLGYRRDQSAESG